MIDTGIGLSKEEQLNVFNEFYQTEYSRNKNIKGTGLGLNICQRIAGMLGGTVGVEGDVSQGSAFWLKLRLTVSPFECYDSIPNFKVGILASEYATLSLRSILMRVGLTPIDIKPDLGGAPSPNIDFCIIHHSALSSHIEKYFTYIPPGYGKKCLVLLPKNGKNTLGKHIENYVTGEDICFDMIKEHALNRDFLREYATNGFKFCNADKKYPNDAGKRLNSFQNHQVLVAEDNEVNQIVISGFLKKLGVTATFANNGLEAVEIYKMNNNLYSLIIMDCQMPVCDGYQAAQMIRQIQKDLSFNRCPIIGLSAHALAVHYTEALSAGMDDYFTKPVTQKNLEKIFQKYLDEGM